jgi:putative transferase (TIGR04331 family)
MVKQRRYLITSTNEKTWKFNEPVVFLGDWCKSYDRKHVWQNIDHVVAPPYGINYKKRKKDLRELKILEDQIFPILCRFLNEFHHEEYDERCWRIILGHWFRQYLQVLFNRFRTLEKCLNLYCITGITFCINNNTLAAKDLSSSLYLYNNDNWNNILYKKILNFIPKINFPVTTIKKKNTKEIFFKETYFRCHKIFKFNIKIFFYKFLRKISKYFIRNNDALIINPYLPYKEHVKLELALGQFPQLLIFGENYNIIEKVNSDLRNDLKDKFIRNFKKAPKNNLRNVIINLLFDCIPICYLEGLSSLKNYTKYISYPKSPKFIFTSNNYCEDEVFKVWTATKVQAGFKYFVGQHGSYNFRNLNTIEEITADKFLTWGSRRDLPNYVSSFIFKRSSKDLNNNKKNDNLLLILPGLEHRMQTFDVHYEHFNHLQNQVNFIKGLSNSISKKLTIRLHKSSFDEFEEKFLQEISPVIKFDKGIINIKKLISKSRLVVHSYDSTGVLETLAQNIPTMTFWDQPFEQLGKDHKAYYKMLVDVGILHLSPLSAAKKINQVWNDVDKWWSLRSVQKVRKKFCNRYSRISNNPAIQLKKIFSKLL